MEKWNEQNISKFNLRSLKKLAVLSCLTALAACGGGGGDATGGGDGKTAYPLKVEVSGLGNNTIILQNNDGIDRGGDNLTVTADGAYQFATLIPTGGNYFVKVAVQPNDGRTCQVINGTGEGSAHMTLVEVNCSGPGQARTIGGTLSNLKATTRIVLLNNKTDKLELNQNGPFQFHQPVPNGGKYEVTIDKQPTGQDCTLINAAHFPVTKNVNDIRVDCVAKAETFSIGGTVNGLEAGKQVKLENRNSNGIVVDTLTVSTNSANFPNFTFGNKIPFNGSYTVTVAADGQPVGQICTPQNNTGNNVEQNITTVKINCQLVDDSFTISGKLEGLTPGNTITLLDNGGDDLALDADGSFTFATKVGIDQDYDVTVGTYPLLQDCTITNGNGTVKNAPIDNVTVKCEVAPITISYSFLPSADGDPSYYPVGLTLAKVGTSYNLYGTATTRDIGGNFWLNGMTGYIFKMPPNSIPARQHWFVGAGDGNTQAPAFPTGIMQAQDSQIYGTTFLGGGDTNDIGGMYKYTISPSDGAFNQKLYAFPADNQGPIGDLIQDAAGNFYGITYGDTRLDVNNNYGSVFKRDGQTGAVTTLHDFVLAKSVTDGIRPNGKLVIKDGFLYGTTEFGGKGKGTIFRIDTTKAKGSNFVAIHLFDNTGTFPPNQGIGPERINNVPLYTDPYELPYSGLMVASDGNLYGMAKYGGTFDAGYIYRITPQGVMTKLHHFTKSNGYPVFELVQFKDASGKPYGKLYGTTQGDGKKYDGVTSMGSIFGINLDGSSFTVLHAFGGVTAGGDGNRPSTRLVVSPDNKSLYGGTRFGGMENLGTIYQLGRK